MSEQTKEPNALERVTSDPVSRRRFMALAGGGGAASFSLLLAACGSGSDTTGSTSGTDTGASKPAAKSGTEQFGKGDLGIVNYALTLEYLEAAFYDDVVKSGLFKGADLTLIKEIGKNEQEHVAALTAAAKQLGGKPAPKPKTKFPLDSADSVLKLAATVENAGAAAYLGQAGFIQSPDILAAALSIHSVEGRHASALNTLTNQSPTPDGPFAKPATAEATLAAVMPFIVS